MGVETPNWVPGVHDKVPLMLGGAMPLLNPRCFMKKRSQEHVTLVILSGELVFDQKLYIFIKEAILI